MGNLMNKVSKNDERIQRKKIQKNPKELRPTSQEENNTTKHNNRCTKINHNSFKGRQTATKHSEREENKCGVKYLVSTPVEPKEHREQ